MNGWTRWVLFALVLAVAAALTAASLNGWDLDLADHYYDGALREPWPVASRGWVEAVDRWGRLPAVLVALVAGGIWIGSFRVEAWRSRRRAAGAVALIVLLGAGALVHGLKAGWGRSRPRDVFHWKRPEPYRDWWEPAGAGVGASFPSGHAASGASLIVVSLIALRRRPLLGGLATTLSVGLAALVAWARVVDGAHFLSDVLWSWLIVLLMVGVVASLGERGPSARAPPNP